MAFDPYHKWLGIPGRGTIPLAARRGAYETSEKESTRTYSRRYRQEYGGHLFGSEQG